MAMLVSSAFKACQLTDLGLLLHIEAPVMTSNIVDFSFLVFKGTFSGVVCKAQVDELIAGEVGYLAASIKAVADARVGDTITLKKNQAAEALAGLFFCPLPVSLLSCLRCYVHSSGIQCCFGVPAETCQTCRPSAHILAADCRSGVKQALFWSLCSLWALMLYQCCLPRSGSGSARQW